MRARLVLAAVASIASIHCAASERPATSLASPEFWQLSTSLSEPAGEFVHPDNLVSNESLYAQFAQMLRVRGGAYIGVGPEQNFSYIARIRPEVAFIVDIRQDNRNLHLLYKALFELASDRADFVSRLFSRTRPLVGRGATAAELFAALDAATPRQDVLDATRALVRERLLSHHQLTLSDDDLDAIDEALDAFYRDGPAIRYGRALPPSRTRPSYRTLMTVADLRGNPQSYLAHDESFAFVKGLHARNAIVPVVGDFAGSHALRRIGDYLRNRGLTLSAFYGSNVEVYLSRDQRRAFCATLQTLPFRDATQFIGSRRLTPFSAKLSACTRIGPSLSLPANLGNPDR